MVVTAFLGFLNMAQNGLHLQEKQQQFKQSLKSYNVISIRRLGLAISQEKSSLFMISKSDATSTILIEIP